MANRPVTENDNINWIEWNGGERPIPKGLSLAIRFRPFKDNNGKAFEVFAKALGFTTTDEVVFDVKESDPLVWEHKGLAGDIIAYGVIDE